ncbi:MAG TPA: hypothetical protein ENK24_04310, partial [Anaerolineae bacterium]|nr:hypothetical protein [Anaerolineae bacterium]
MKRLTSLVILSLIIFILFLGSGCLGARITPSAAESQPRAAVTETQPDLVAPSAAITAPRRPFPQHVSYAPGTIRPTHRTQAQQDNDARAAYDAWKRNYLKVVTSTGEAMYRVSFGSTNPERTVSEGQGYGML